MKEKIKARLQEDYDYLKSLGFEVVGVFLQGSQNYNVHTERSDIDTKAIVLPSLRDITENKKAYAKTLFKEDSSHLDVKDIRSMFHEILKQNINFVEILFTEYSLLNPEYEQSFKRILESKEEIARCDIQKTFSAAKGMVDKANKEARAGLERGDEVFAAKKFSHIVRYNNFLEAFIGDRVPLSYDYCLKFKSPEVLSVKNGEVSLEEVEEVYQNVYERIEQTDPSTVVNFYRDAIVAELNDEIEKMLLKNFSKKGKK